MSDEGELVEAHAQLPLPQRLGRYDLLCEIGRGGMATVYLARSRGMGGFERNVAIKVCKASIRNDGESRSMFMDEARLAAHIHHPNVAAMLDVVDDKQLYLVMDYVEGGSLVQLLKIATRHKTRIPPHVGLKIVCDALTGLHAAHQTRDSKGKLLNVVHRDVSPQNILVGVDGVTRIVDFGIAKADEREAQTEFGKVKGKFDYMSPEQLMSGEVKAGSDVFSAGVVLWETLAGRRLFGAASLAETVDKLSKLHVPALRGTIAGVTLGLDEVIKKALAREASNRFETAADFAQAIETAGSKIATAREVGAFVTEYMGKELEARREAVRAALDALGPDPVIAEQAEDGASSGLRPVRRVTEQGGEKPKEAEATASKDSAEPAATPAPAAAVEDDEPRITFLGEPFYRTRKGQIAIGGAAVLLLVFVGAIASSGSSQTPSAPPPHAVTTAAVHQEPVAHPTPPPAPIAVAPPAPVVAPPPAAPPPAPLAHPAPHPTASIATRPAGSTSASSTSSSAHAATTTHSATPASSTTNSHAAPPPRHHRQEYTPGTI